MEEINKFWNLVDARASKEAIHFIAQIVSVDEGDRSCVVKINDKISYDDVRLYSVINPDLKGFFVVPKVDSLVMASRIGDSNELFVSMFSEVDKIRLTIGDKTEVFIDEKELSYANDKVKVSIKDNKVSIEADKITFNSGDNKGLVKIKELEDNLKALKDYVEAINTALPSAFTAIGVAMGAMGANGSTAYQGSMAGKVIVFKEMENDKVKH